ncbi:MAG: DUF4301 family protein [Syntrophales bacterium]|jgi:hypothetical protein|nr:DUF4301 family protein [Syntrophales bacterium]MDY0043253.1 DUF4301 family protein [Syntrophales bacterium]
MDTNTLFSVKDVEAIEAKGLTPEEVLRQLKLLRKGSHPVDLIRPCTASDGIEIVDERRIKILLAAFDKARSAGRITKFVPASGAASRMFKDWFRFLDMAQFDGSKEAQHFAEELPDFAFYGDLADMMEKKGLNLQELQSGGYYKKILEYILLPKGLDYGQSPKAVLAFHTYPQGTRTPVEEHLAEAALYGTDAAGNARVHFTVSEEHKTKVDSFISRITGNYEKLFSALFDVSVSAQQSSTDTVAIAMDGSPFRDKEGNIIFRPGGHGSLLRNLNDLEGDIIFMKNIDNVVPDRLKPETVFYKKILAGLLMELQETIFKYLSLIESGDCRNEDIMQLREFYRKWFSLSLPPEFDKKPLGEKTDFFHRCLHRPIRVCGMVRNEGEPGGGPFWVRDADGTESKQIIEKAQVALETPGQEAIWNSSTHFNPVDIVCGVRDHKGNPFDLETFVDKETYLVSEKTYEGRNLKALEHPGLWNGSMAYWNTVFVEVPLSTFAPVKTVEDLLRPEHG